MRTVFLAVLGGACATAAIAQMQNTGPLNRDLRPPSSFSSITNQPERSRALFGEIAKVLTHPRCMNCHPAGEHPLQGADRHEHMPPAWRGDGGTGIAGALCSSCHTEKNFTLVGTDAGFKSIPAIRAGGAPRSRWHGKASRSARSASRSRTRTAMAGARSHSCTSI